MESITCPACGMTSYHPTDVREGYCGNCHAFTGGVTTMAKASKNTRGMKAANPARGGGGCDTGRKRYPNKRAAADASSTGTATRCGRCNGFHADDDHPRRRR